MQCIALFEMEIELIDRSAFSDSFSAVEKNCTNSILIA